MNLLATTPAALLAQDGTVAGSAAASGAIQETGSWLLIALPLLGAALLLLGGRRTNRWGHWLGVLTPWASFALAAALLVSLAGYPEGERSRTLHLFGWMPAGQFRLDAGLLIDPLSVAFAVLVTFVGALIHSPSPTWLPTGTGAGSSPTSTSSSPRCCCSSSPTATC